MKISVFGLGYVGCVSIGCFASLGHKLIGVDVDKRKVDLIKKGKPTIIEQDISVGKTKDYNCMILLNIESIIHMEVYLNILFLFPCFST